MLISVLVFIITCLVVISTTLALLLRQRTAQVNKLVALCNQHINAVISKSKKIAQHERTITLLMDREMDGTWLPNADAKYLIPSNGLRY